MKDVRFKKKNVYYGKADFTWLVEDVEGANSHEQYL